MKLVAIDFETADEQPDSACSVALVCIEGGKVTGVWSSLICPPRTPAARNVAVNGLGWDTLRQHPPFKVVGRQVLELLGDAEAIVAHNADFDRRVMEASCRAAGIEPPALPWHCTVALARKAWPALDNHKLPTVCSHLGIALKHHDAESDAQAAARIYLAAKLAEARAVASPAPLVASVERTGTEGRHRWTWTTSPHRAELRLDGDRLFSIGVLDREASRWRIQIHGKAHALVRIEAQSVCLGRLDELLLEGLRAAVLVAKEDGWELSPDAWARIAKARPHYNPKSNTLEVRS